MGVGKWRGGMGGGMGYRNDFFKRKNPLKSVYMSFWLTYSETLNNEYIERIHQMSYSSLSDNGMLQIFSFLIKWLYKTL